MEAEYPLNLILFASAKASINFALECLEPFNGHLRLKSSFVTPQGEIMHWHDFGDLEGPGWAANAVGGAQLLYRWGTYFGDTQILEQALALLDHVMEDGFIDPSSGFIWPYYHLAEKRFCLNYKGDNDWLCPGSLAKIGVQMLEFAAELPASPRPERLREYAYRLGRWLMERVPLLPDGWAPRRMTIQGEPYPLTPEGKPDPIFARSADGLFMLHLWAALSTQHLERFADQAQHLGEAFIEAGGYWGSLNHDTYDDHENLAYAIAFRIFRQAAGWLNRPAWRDFAYQIALPGLERYRMKEDRHGVPTRGLLWMEDSWNTAYLWENAEAALAYLEAWSDTAEATYLQNGLEILRAIADHHHGNLGFLTEGVDWDNIVTRRHHVREALYGDICYTEPLLNNLHHVAPALYYFDRVGYLPPDELDDPAAIELVKALNWQTNPPVPGRDGVRYLLRLYYPALETDARLEQALAFASAAGVDGVLLFEASYDMDPALLTLPQLEDRFARLKAIVPRFRHIVQEVNINVMITLGHVDAGSARPERFPFQFQVDEHGAVSRAAVCPLDPGFLEHAAALYRMAAECGADAVWVDDDTRYLWHDLTGLTCFCPLHLAAFAERSGRSWTRPELVAALIADPPEETGQAHLRKAWLELQEESILHLAQILESSVHALDPRMQIGLMTVGSVVHHAEGRRTDRLLRLLAGSTRPLIRPGAGFWSDWQPAALLDKTEDCARTLSFLGEDVRAVAEVENHPYTPYGKSERVLELELALDVLAGMPDLGLNLLSSMGGNGELEPEGTDYAAFLRRQRPFLDALGRVRSGRVRHGVGVYANEAYAQSARLHGDSLMGWVESRPWEIILARLGLPVGRPDQAPHWFAGEVARSLTDAELDRFLLEGAVFDPIAAQVLLERGRGRRLGLLGLRPVGDAVNECLSADSLNEARAGIFLPAYNHIPPSDLYTFELEPGAGRVLSRWVNVDGQDLGPAALLLENPLGWRVGLLPYAIQSPAAVLLNVAHREQWRRMLEWAARASLPCRVTRGVNLALQAFLRLEEHDWMLAVANLSADDLAAAEISLPAGSWEARRLDAQGNWGPAHMLEKNRLRFEIGAFSLGVFRCHPLA